MFETLILCATILSAFPIPNDLDPAEAHDECRAIAVAAAEANLSPALVVALGYHESKFDRTASPGKFVEAAKGSLQILPQWHCPDYRACRKTQRVSRCKDLVEACDFIAGGINALDTYLARANASRGQGRPLNEFRSDKRIVTSTNVQEDHDPHANMHRISRPDPISLLRPVASLPLAVFFQMGTPFPAVQDRAYAAALVLIVLVLGLSITSRLLSTRFTKNIIR